ncbi:MAG: uroporphyrinogen-III synthase, partial [Melioribacteraceae bacterium]|nr:uroporphyrinogen-III synthase [Melioribacteraceae bacterium]
KYIIYKKRKVFFGKNKFDELLEILEDYKDEKFLIPLSDKHKQEIPKKLEEHNFTFTKAIIYKTVNSDLSHLEIVSYDVLVFFSPSGIKSLFKNFPDFIQNDTKIAAFGPSTSKMVEEMGLRLDIQAPTNHSPSMTMALESYIKKYNRKKKEES